MADEPMTASSPVADEPMMPMLLQTAAWISLIAGIVGFFALLPGEPEYGYSWKGAAFIPAISCIAAGIFEGLLFGALGVIIGYLDKISRKHA